jgi:hypothetical protein
MGDPKKIKELCENLVRDVIEAHQEFLRQDRMVFDGQILTVNLEEDLGSAHIEFTEEFKEFFLHHAQEGTFQDPLDKTTIVLLKDRWTTNGKEEKEGNRESCGEVHKVD